MKPYYEQSGVTIYHGDCREVKTAVDAIITDPVWPNAPAGMFPSVEDPLMLLWEMFGFHTATRVSIVLRHDCDPRFLEVVPKSYQFFRAMILPYVMPGYIGRKLGGDELAYCFGEPVKFQRGRQVIPRRAPSVQPTGRPPNGHPCSRAQEHMDFVVTWWSDMGETVLDPFYGKRYDARRSEASWPESHRYRNRRTVLRNRGTAASAGSFTAGNRMRGGDSPDVDGAVSADLGD